MTLRTYNGLRQLSIFAWRSFFAREFCSGNFEEVSVKQASSNSTFKSLALLGTAAILLCGALGFASPKYPFTGPASPALAADKGKLTIKLDGQTVGHEEFEIAPSAGGWVAKGTTDVKPPQSASTKISGTLVLQPDGAPISYEWTSKSDKTNGAHILFANGIAKITLEMQGARPFEQDLTFGAPLIAVLDNNLYHQYAVLARVYDWNKRGPQTFPVLIPQELTPGSITVESTGSASVDGKSYDGLKVSTSDIEVLLLLDSTHRLMRLEVPAAKVSVIRD